MRDTFTRENSRDFQARYAGSYGYYITDKGKSLPVFLSHVDDNTLYFQDLNGVEFNTVVNSGSMFEFMQLTRRLYAGLDGNIYMIQRRPARQWVRGVCSANTLGYMLTTKRGAVQVPINHALMRNILISDEPAKLANGNIKLSDQFAICGTNLFLYDMVIGVYLPEEKKVSLLSNWSLFSTEVQDATRPHNIEVVKNA